MLELRFLVAPGNKKIVGVLETMKVYREVPNRSVWLNDDNDICYEHDHLKSRLHHVNPIMIFIDEDGKHWFARDLCYVPSQRKPQLPHRYIPLSDGSFAIDSPYYHMAFRPIDDGTFTHS